MALNLQTLKTRSLTAAIFVVVMLTGLLLNRWGFIALFILIHLGCWYEWILLLKRIDRKRYKRYLPLGAIYISLPLCMMIDMGIPDWEQPFSPLLPCAIIFSIWINDTMAYMIGSLIGKTPFSAISPKKTWEGTIGGALLCVVVAGGIAALTSILPISIAAEIALICAIFGTAGDLLESKLKRMANVKDSGKIMPGHGGFLDRFDSLLVATPFVWVFIKLFVW